MLCLSLGRETLNNQLYTFNTKLLSPTLQPIRSRFIPRKRLLNGTIGRSSDLSYFASFPIGLPPISGLFAKDTSVVSCLKFQFSGNKLVNYKMRTYSSGSVTDSHRIPFSIRALLLIPTIRYSKLGAKILLFYKICK